MALARSPEEINRLIRELEIPFDASVIEWRVTNTTPGKSRGQVIPYTDQRAYTDRLNALVTPAGWTCGCSIHTSANFECSRDQKIVAKVLVTCELTIFGLGSHSATGEEWADNDNAGTSAEALAFKRACAAVSDSAATSITSRACGSIWTNESGPKQFLIWPVGRHQQVGCRACIPMAPANQTVERMLRKRTVHLRTRALWLPKSRVWRNSSAGGSTGVCCAIWRRCGIPAKLETSRDSTGYWSTCGLRNAA